MPSPSAIWVCDRPSCWRMRRNLGPTNSFFPESAGMAAFLTYFVTKLTKLHLLQVRMLHDITIRKQAIYTNFAFWRLGLATRFAMHCQECRQPLRICRYRKDQAHELPATRDQRPGHPGTGFLSERAWSCRGAPQDPADLERRYRRGRGAHASAEPLQDRPGYRPLHSGADAQRHGCL